MLICMILIAFGAVTLFLYVREKLKGFTVREVLLKTVVSLLFITVAICAAASGEGAVFSGDTLFHGSIGRTDFPSGSYSQLINSIKTKLLVLPRDTEVLPGHDSRTTIAYEANYNPFLD